jgi:hypothetical protein
MDETYRLKIKVGPHEFEAEGPPDAVREQFQSFKEMLASMPAFPPPFTQPPAIEVQNITAPPPPAQDASFNEDTLDKIIRVDGRVVSLTVRPQTVSEAVLVILYVQKVRRQNDAVTGAEVMNGLTTTGGYSVTRVDRVMTDLSGTGDVIVIGVHRARRYRLTNSGFNRARQIAASLVAMVP